MSNGTRHGTVPKPETDSLRPDSRTRQSNVPVTDSVVPRPSRQPSRPPVSWAPKPSRVSLVVIGASTGGPQCLHAIIPALHKDFPVPVLVVQHMPPMFTESMATLINAKSALSVKEAESGDPVVAGSVLIAPGGRHMLVRRSSNGLVVDLDDGPKVQRYRPSFNRLLKSLVGLTDSPILTVTLTGMGDDGLEGIEQLHSQGTYNLVQDEKTSVIHSMPRAIIDKGLANEILPVDVMAFRINKLVEGALPKHCWDTLQT